MGDDVNAAFEAMLREVRGVRGVTGRALLTASLQDQENNMNDRRSEVM